MADSDAPIIRCPNCDKAYRWKIELAGKKVQCKCTQKFRVPALASGKVERVGEPANPAAPADAGGYDVDFEDEHAAPARPAAGGRGAGGDDGRCPSCGQKIKPTAVICLGCGFNLKEGTKVQTKVLAGGGPVPAAAAAVTGGAFAGAITDSVEKRAAADVAMAEDAEKRHRFETWILPLILIGVGALVVVAANMGHAVFDIQDPASPQGLMLGIARVVQAFVFFIIQLPLMLVGIIIVAKLFGSSYGGIFSALLKLAAIALCTSAAGDTVLILIYFMTGGTSVMGVELMMSFGAALLTFIGLCMKLLDMDVLEAIVMYLVITIGPWIALFFLGAVIAGFFA